MIDLQQGGFNPVNISLWYDRFIQDKIYSPPIKLE